MDKVKAKKNLREILDKMQNTDTAQLLEYYKLFKKEIPFFKRGWTAAWLFMYYDRKESPDLQNESKVKFDKPPRDNEPVKQAENRISLAEEESKRLFISIGKNRRLFPKEIISLILSRSSAVREDIGIIRILDNYSFVQVRDAKADEIIEALTGHRFRGRTLTVNYAKPKTENDDNNPEE